MSAWASGAWAPGAWAGTAWADGSVPPQPAPTSSARGGFGLPTPIRRREITRPKDRIREEIESLLHDVQAVPVAAPAREALEAKVVEIEQNYDRALEIQEAGQRVRRANLIAAEIARLRQAVEALMREVSQVRSDNVEEQDEEQIVLSAISQWYH